MPAIMKLDVGVAPPGFVNFTGDIVLGVPSGHQHAWQHRDGPRAARDAALNPFGDDRLGELQKAAFDDALWRMGPEEIDQAEELPRAVRIPAAVSGQKNRRL